MSSNSISLAGAQLQECANCKARYAAQIARCNGQSSSQGSGQVNTHGLPDPIEYCAYQIFQPGLNNNRYEIGKCSDPHPNGYLSIYGPETFTHYQQWPIQKGLRKY